MRYLAWHHLAHHLAQARLMAAISWLQNKVGCIAVACMGPQEPTAAMLVSSCILPPPPKPAPPQITSTTFKAEGVCLGPQ